MTYEDLLAALLAKVGRRVVAHIFPTGAALPPEDATSPPEVARLTGVLERAQNLHERLQVAGSAPSDDDADGLFFTVGGSDSGFFLQRRLYLNAVEDGHRLRIYLSTVVLLVADA